MKKMLSLTIIAGCMSTNFAFAGVYGDLNLGANFVNTSKRLIYPLDISPVSNSKFNASYNNFHGQLALGYDLSLIGQWKLALEGDVDFYTGKSSYTVSNWFSTDTANATEQFNYGWDLFLLPEYQLNEKTQLFVGPGISTSQFNIGNQNAATGGNLGYTGHKSLWLNSWGVKAGASIAITTAFDLLLTYQFMDYKAFTVTSEEPFTLNLVQSRYRPIVNTVMVGLKYVMDRPVPANMLTK